jgi:hypothetical protein
MRFVGNSCKFTLNTVVAGAREPATLHFAAKETLRRLPASNSNPFSALSAAAENSSV